MNLKRSWLGRCGLVVTVACAPWVTACGGSAFSGTGGAGAGGTGAGGAGAIAGTSAGGTSTTGGTSAGGTSTTGGTSTGGAGAGGRVCNVACTLPIACNGESVTKPGECCPTCEPAGGAGGTANGGSGGVCNGACTAIGCGPGFKSVVEPGACCPTCVPDGSAGTGGVGGCLGIACPAIDCAQGYMFQQQAGSCCPTCVPNNACTTGQQSYSALRQKLLAQPGALACMVSKDCTLLAGSGYCGDACSQVPVNVSAAQGIASELSIYAKNNCSTCPPGPAISCTASPIPACVQGVCVPQAPTRL